MIIIDIGCHNGNDEAFSFIKKFQNQISKVYLIDASIGPLKQCKKLYIEHLMPDNIEKISFYNYALVDEPNITSIKLYHPQEDPLSGFASLSPEHVTAHKHENLDAITVPTTTINYFLNSLDIKFIDRLYIDIEGWDAKILLDLDFNKYKIPYIMFEHLHLDGPFKKGILASKLFLKLRNFGYKILQKDYNIIAVI